MRAYYPDKTQSLKSPMIEYGYINHNFATLSDLNITK
ncbi:hypothetical protein GMA8713_01836 [Grimontia marina]|uniref:Uncharacterized protein n=1 Tax=Grimontia marina TaxID=646534 RepID=A0A128F3Q8_9GAMM|nr:hypothetical protein GMA8713_01836 [Grimontia marina]